MFLDILISDILKYQYRRLRSEIRICIERIEDKFLLFNLQGKMYLVFFYGRIGQQDKIIILTSMDVFKKWPVQRVIFIPQQTLSISFINLQRIKCQNQSYRYMHVLNPYLTSKTYVVGTQKKSPTETILFSTHNLGFNECEVRYHIRTTFTLSSPL